MTNKNVISINTDGISPFKQITLDLVDKHSDLTNDEPEIHLPGGGVSGQVLTHDGTKGVWQNLPTSGFDVNTETLVAQKTITINSKKYQRLSGTQNVIMSDLASSARKELFIECTSGAISLIGADWTDIIYAGHYKAYVWTGTRWEGITPGSNTTALRENQGEGFRARAVGGVAYGNDAIAINGTSYGHGAESVDHAEAHGNGAKADHWNSIAHDNAQTVNITEESRNIHQDSAEPAHLSELAFYRVQDDSSHPGELLLGGIADLVAIPWNFTIMAYRATIIGRNSQDNYFCRFEFDITISKFNASLAIFPSPGTQIFPIHQAGAPNSFCEMWNKTDADFGIMVCADEPGEWTWSARLTGLHHKVNA